MNNTIWIDKHGPHLELSNGPTYKWSYTYTVVNFTDHNTANEKKMH